MPNFGSSDRDLLDRIARLEAHVTELSRAPGQTQSSLRDAADNIVLSTADAHLGRPYLPITFHDRQPYLTWTRCQVRVWEPLRRAHIVKQHPAFSAILCGISGPGAPGATDGSQNGGSGYLRLTVNGQPVIPDVRVAQFSGEFALPVGPFALPGAHMDAVVIELWGKSDWTTAYIAGDVINGYSREWVAPGALAESADQDDDSI